MNCCEYGLFTTELCTVVVSCVTDRNVQTSLIFFDKAEAYQSGAIHS
jgi:hypothetical protein